MDPSPLLLSYVLWAMSVIDLDRPPAATPPPARHRVSRRLLTSVAILLTGAVLGGAATWTYAGHRHPTRDSVSVLVLPGTAPQVDTGVGRVVMDGEVVDATLTRRVTLVNAGPRPVNVHNLNAVRPGLTVRGTDKQRWIEPGAAVQADADVRITCSGGLPIRELSVRLEVQTDDNQERTATAVLDATQWNDQARVACNGDLS